MKTRAWRKQIDFKTLDVVRTIKIAVKIIFSKCTKGETISFTSFVVHAAHSAALEVIKANPDFMKQQQYTTDAVKIIKNQLDDSA